MAFSRPIIASTRARTCSFFCISVARSAESVSWRWRSALVLFLELRDHADQLVEAALEALELAFQAGFAGLVHGANAATTRRLLLPFGG